MIILTKPTKLANLLLVNWQNILDLSINAWYKEKNYFT